MRTSGNIISPPPTHTTQPTRARSVWAFFISNWAIKPTLSDRFSRDDKLTNSRRVSKRQRTRCRSRLLGRVRRCTARDADGTEPLLRCGSVDDEQFESTDGRNRQSTYIPSKEWPAMPVTDVDVDRRPLGLSARHNYRKPRQGGRVRPNAFACRANLRRFKSGPWLFYSSETTCER